MNRNSIKPIISKTNFETKIVENIDELLLKNLHQPLFITKYISFDRFGVGFLSYNSLNKFQSSIISPLLFKDKEKAFLRGVFYYKTGKSIDDLINNLKIIISLFHKLTNLSPENIAEHIPVIFTVLDNLRNVVLHIYGLSLETKLSTLREVLRLYNVLLHEYFAFIINGNINLSSIDRILQVIDINNLRSILNKIGKDKKFSSRELDNPLEIILFSLQIICSKNKYDLMVDFPSGSLSLSDSVNIIAKMINNKPVAKNTLSINTSLYRLKDSKTEIYLIRKLNSKLKNLSNKSILLVDDNFFSGGTLIFFRSLFLKQFKAENVDCAVVSIYLKGLNEWRKSKYQFISDDFLLTTLLTLEALDEKYPEIFVRRNEILYNHGIKAVDNSGKIVFNSHYYWQAEIKRDDFNVFNGIYPRVTIDKLKKKYGFHFFSLIYNKYFDTLTFRPVSEVSFDELTKYITKVLA